MLLGKEESPSINVHSTEREKMNWNIPYIVRCKSYSSPSYALRFKIALLQETFSSQMTSSPVLPASCLTTFLNAFGHLILPAVLCFLPYLFEFAYSFLSVKWIPSLPNFSNYATPSFFQNLTEMPLPPWSCPESSVSEMGEGRGNIYGSPVLYWELC